MSDTKRIPVCPNGHKPDHWLIFVPTDGDSEVFQMSPDGDVVCWEDGTVGIPAHWLELANDSEESYCPTCNAECDWADAPDNEPEFNQSEIIPFDKNAWPWNQGEGGIT